MSQPKSGLWAAQGGRLGLTAHVHGVLVGFYPAQAATLDATYACLANHGLTGHPGLALGEAVGAELS